MRYWSEYGDFFREYRRHVRTTGALMPSSRFLARALVTEVRRPRPAGRILEAGPGTGSVTRQIVRHLLPGDHLDAVEINPSFVALLQRTFDREWLFRFHRDQISLIEAPIQELAGEAKYDLIVSGLPLNNFPGSLVREIFQVFSRLLKPGGTLSYYEYVFVRQLKSPFANPRERRRLYRVGRVVRNYIQAYQIRRQRVLMNVPPAIVRHLRFRPEFAAGELITGPPLQDASRTASSAIL